MYLRIVQRVFRRITWKLHTTVKIAEMQLLSLKG